MCCINCHQSEIRTRSDGMRTSPVQRKDSGKYQKAETFLCSRCVLYYAANGIHDLWSPLMRRTSPAMKRTIPPNTIMMERTK